MSVNISHALFSLFDLLTFEERQIGCRKMSVRYYHSTLHNIPKEHRSHMMIWDAGLGLALHSPV
jgi:hypothetical protein